MAQAEKFAKTIPNIGRPQALIRNLAARGGRLVLNASTIKKAAANATAC